jgi:hypothetical protein
MKKQLLVLGLEMSAAAMATDPCLDKHMEEFVSFGAHGNHAIGPNDTGLTPAEIRRVLSEISNGARALTNYDE